LGLVVFVVFGGGHVSPGHQAKGTKRMATESAEEQPGSANIGGKEPGRSQGKGAASKAKVAKK